jgi:hypothetical protein
MVEEADAEFITRLRTDPLLARHISNTSTSVDSQRTWIRGYLERQRKGLEFYFIICDSAGQSLGTFRVYQIQSRECTAGSWLMKSGSPPMTSLESHLASMFFIFEVLRLEVMHIDVRKENMRVLAWHEFCGARFSHDDEANRYFDYTPEIFISARSKVYAMINASPKTSPQRLPTYKS